MKITSLHGQMTFDEMKGSLERLPKTNRWVRHEVMSASARMKIIDRIVQALFGR